MKKFIKNGKIVIVLSGRFAGRKAVVLRTYDEGNKDRKFGHALIVGVDVAPRKTTKSMGVKRLARRQTVVPFVKYVNFNHIMPTRYQLDIGEKLRDLVKEDVLFEEPKEGEEAQTRQARLKTVRTALEERYKKLADPKFEGNVKGATGALYFFRKLKF